MVIMALPATAATFPGEVAEITVTWLVIIFTRAGVQILVCVILPESK